MNTPIWTRLIVTALAGSATLALAPPALGQGDELILRRDGSKAVPLVADVTDTNATRSGAPVLRRDGSKAVPFVANVDPKASPTADSFDWGDAAVGAGLGAAAALAAVGSAAALRTRRGALPAAHPELGRRTASG